jgi:hypothetical protein
MIETTTTIIIIIIIISQQANVAVFLKMWATGRQVLVQEAGTKSVTQYTEHREVSFARFTTTSVERWYRVPSNVPTAVTVQGFLDALQPMQLKLCH